MEGYSALAFVMAAVSLGAIYRLNKRVKELEKPIVQKKREEALITKAEVLSLIEKSKKG